VQPSGHHDLCPEGFFYLTNLLKQEAAMLKLFATPNHPAWQRSEPVYVIRDGRFFRTVYHPAGWSDVPDYELRADGSIHRTPHHKLGASDTPDYVIGKDQGLYRAASHPDKDDASAVADFVLRDE
jgi:hypothetical protein